MISGRFFQNLSRRTGIKAEALEKDYVMNLILDAIAHCTKTRDVFFFKGGCCVHKCFSAHMFHPKERGVDDYFYGGRFSSDIDLTVHPDMMQTHRLNDAFKELKEYLYHRHGLVIEQFSFPIYENIKQKINGHHKKNCRGMIRFRGPMYHERFNPPALKFDITADERMVFTPYKRLIHHPYSCEGEELVLVALTYTLRDIFAEKIRALFERCSPRDVYDLNTLIQHPDLERGRALGIGLSILEKFQMKNVPLDLNVNQLTASSDGAPSAYDRCRRLWKISLGRQMSRLPAFEKYWGQIPHIVLFAKQCVDCANEQINICRQKHQMSRFEAMQTLLKEQNCAGNSFQRVIDRHLKLKNKGVSL